MTVTKHKVTVFTACERDGWPIYRKLAESRPHKVSGYRASFRVTANHGAPSALKDIERGRFLYKKAANWVVPRSSPVPLDRRAILFFGGNVKNGMDVT